MFSTFPWRLLLLKLAALFAFCGGPLVVSDLLKAHLHKDVAFAIAFAPSVALIFGVYSLWESKPDRWDTAMVLFGAVGAAVLVAMNVLAISELIDTPDRADGGLIRVGIGVGLVFVAFYAHATRRFFVEDEVNAD
jgi:hypothetical protein